MKLFIINIGASSTKLAIYNNDSEEVVETIRHKSEDLLKFEGLWDQLEYRRGVITSFLERNSVNLKDLAAIVSRGPVVKPLESGVYRINQEMIEDARSGIYGVHPCGLGCEIALELSNDEIPCFTVDPPCVDEMIDVARITGLPEIKRISFFQALNHKAKGYEYAQKIGKKYEDLNIVVTHLGSGISVASHKKGRVIDVTNGLAGDSPFGLDRVGTLPAEEWAEYCIANQLSLSDLKKIINGGGGIKAHLNTNNAIEVEEMIKAGNKHAKLIYEAMAFQVGKGIGAAAAALTVKPDVIIVTGGLANSDRFINYLTPMIDWMAPLYINPDDNEIMSLAKGALRGLENPNIIKDY
ncbi:butyrate kinase [Vagococcus fluvialis]|uniref:Probable butyrate kinase n=1 Tax=Vagococcus fluvialis TaxID=2738 RepID=A0A7X6I3G5_9ENTE|nr:butyrate kinase [Vagococcus fluvialis]NKC68558.1 butyrate kinase [Vagococcus fluvialis]